MGVADPGPVMLLAGFTRAVGGAGIEVTPDRTRSFLTACVELGAADLTHVYWAGRATLAPRPDQLRTFDAVFRRWFSGSLVRARSPLPPNPWPTNAPPPNPAPGAGFGATGQSPPDSGFSAPEVVGEESPPRGAVASSLDLLRDRDLAALTPAERAEVARLFAAVRPRAPRRPGHRWRPSSTGFLDVRRTLRAELRRGGEPGRLLYRRRARRPRRVVLLLDVSGSMAPYADALLRLAHVWVRSAPATTEVFTMGTRLTRVTVPLRSPDPAGALLAAGAQVPDWSGGTRLGEVLRAFLDGWGQRGSVRGAVLVVLSDGWERGDAALLGEQAARARRLAHRVIWVSPHRDREGYRPVQAGLRAALPHCDAFLAGHSLAAFRALASVVADA